MSKYVQQTLNCNESTNRNWRNPDWLREQYIERERSLKSIAGELDVTFKCVYQTLEGYGIEVRPGGTTAQVSKLRDKEWLQEKYVDEQKSAGEIGTELDSCSTTVLHWLSKHGIETRCGKRDPDDLSHTVDSGWELSIARLMNSATVEYQHEAIEIPYVIESDDGYYSATYTPDYVTEDYVIEVKGCNWGQVHGSSDYDAERKAQAAMDYLDREYVVVGAALEHCDRHVPYEERREFIASLS